MNFQTAWRYSIWAFEFLFLPPMAIVGVIAAWVFMAGTHRRRLAQHWRRHYWLTTTHWLFFVAAILVGVIFEKPSGYSTPVQPLGRVCLQLIMYGSFASCAFWIWRMQGIRWYAASLMVLLELPTLGALMVAGMSVAGDWL